MLFQTEFGLLQKFKKILI